MADKEKPAEQLTRKELAEKAAAAQEAEKKSGIHDPRRKKPAGG